MARFLGEAMAWVALGTVADMVPLAGENRILAARGLRAIPLSTSPGLIALCSVAGIRKGAPFGEEEVSFKLAPRLNAAGRMGRNDLALKLLIADTEAEALGVARELDALNKQRQVVDREIAHDVAVRLSETPKHEPVVMHDDRWNTGLLGLVAGRLAGQIGRPAVLISAAHGDPAKGSCRSVPGFDVHAALAACTEHLVSHGGHAMAAGFTIRRDAIPAFRTAFVEQWALHVAAGARRAPLEYDGELPLAALTPRIIEQLERLAPFGQGNARPVLGAMGVVVHEARRMGDGSHLALQVGQGECTLRAVAFGKGDLADALPRGTGADVLFKPRRNHFRGQSTVELELVDLRPAATTASRAAPPVPVAPSTTPRPSAGPTAR